MQLPFCHVVVTRVQRGGEQSRVLSFPHVPSPRAAGDCSLHCGDTSCVMPPGLPVQAGQNLSCLPAHTQPLTLSPAAWGLLVML